MRTAESVVLDALAARSAGAHHVDAQLLRVDLDVDLVGFGHHRDRDGRGVDASLRFGRRHALDAVYAALVLQAAEDAVAGDRRDDFLHAARAALRHRQQLDLPAAAFGVARVHSKEIAGEERRLLPSGAARISRITLRSSFGSRGTSSTRSSRATFSISGSSRAISSRASLRRSSSASSSIARTPARSLSNFR